MVGRRSLLTTGLAVVAASSFPVWATAGGVKPAPTVNCGCSSSGSPSPPSPSSGGGGGGGGGGGSGGGSGQGQGGGQGKGGGRGGGQGSGSSQSSGGSASSSSQSSSGGTVSISSAISTGVNTGSFTNSTANSVASANALLNNAASTAAGGGGGGGWSLDQGVSGVIQALHVDDGDPTPRPVCIQYRAVQKIVAVQAVCLDDRAVPHPASQVSPERDVPATFEGEIYRCIAGARMQYTVGEFAGQASFDHGQTITCDKGMALYYGGEGRLMCRPQKPARDCNERSLLRRFGAGIKVLRASAAQTCVAYSGHAEAASVSLNMTIDGGVGGVVH